MEEEGRQLDEAFDELDKLQVGSPAPYFEMEGYFKGEFKKFSPEDCKGKWTMLFFYPLDFTFVCPTELIELNKRISDFEKLGVQVYGVSVDSVHSHKAWAKEMGDFNYPLLSDMNKMASLDYGVLLQEEGIALRGTFIVDDKGILQSSTINNLPVGRNIDEHLRTIQALQTGDLCPINWNKGEDTLGKA